MKLLNMVTLVIIYLSAFLMGRTEAALECVLTHAGHDYMGTRNRSSAGHPCQRWDSQTPHGHIYTNPVSYPDTTVSEASNYCRNPDQQWGGGAWCFLDMSQYRWQACNIPLCECKTDRAGYDYVGEISHTASGLECQYWDSPSPHPHNFTEDHQFPDRDLIDAGNHCRNPDSHRPAGPWCYTLDPDVEFEYCDIPFCDGYPITTAAPTSTTTAATATSEQQDNEETTLTLSTTPPPTTAPPPTTTSSLSSPTPSPSVSNHGYTHIASTSTYQTKNATTTTTKPTGKVPEPKVKGSTAAQGAGRTAGIALGAVFGIVVLAGAGGGFVWWRYYRGRINHGDDRGIMENFANPLYDKPKGAPRPVSAQGGYVNQEAVGVGNA